MWCFDSVLAPHRKKDNRCIANDALITSESVYHGSANKCTGRARRRHASLRSNGDTQIRLIRMGFAKAPLTALRAVLSVKLVALFGGLDSVQLNVGAIAARNGDNLIQFDAKARARTD